MSYTMTTVFESDTADGISIRVDPDGAITILDYGKSAIDEMNLQHATGLYEALGAAIRHASGESHASQSDT